MTWYIDDEKLERCRTLSKHGRVIAFDTETTGMSNEDEIVQIAAVEYVDGRQTRTLNLYLVPTCDVSARSRGSAWSLAAVPRSERNRAA